MNPRDHYKRWMPREIATMTSAFAEGGPDLCYDRLPHRSKIAIHNRLLALGLLRRVGHARTDQLALIGLTIHDLFPSLIANGARSGQRIAETTCMLLRELNVLRTLQTYKPLVRMKKA